MSAPAGGDSDQLEQERPATGLPAVDDALAQLGDLEQRPVSEHHAVLAEAHESLHQALESPSGPADGRG